VNGHEVSGFLKHKLNENLKNFFYENKISSNDSNFDLYTKEMFVKTNEDLSNEIDSNIMFSGSTCISVVFTPSKIFCANLGDSRAVMGRQSQGGIPISFYFLLQLRKYLLKNFFILNLSIIT